MYWILDTSNENFPTGCKSKSIVLKKWQDQGGKFSLVHFLIWWIFNKLQGQIISDTM